MLMTMDLSITSCMDLLQVQPPDLVRHSKNVSTLAVLLSMAAGCPSATQERIRVGSLLHDIGKQFVPGRILNKQGKLAPVELLNIQEHAWLGYAHLTNFTSDATVLQTVLYHHERWNGTGYPYGLQGESIPLEARICSLADVWDALVTDRCYRSAWNDTQAIELIWAGAGSLFDPLLTSQFLGILEEYRSEPEPPLPLPIKPVSENATVASAMGPSAQSMEDGI